jgi:heme exporter protein B
MPEHAAAAPAAVAAPAARRHGVYLRTIGAVVWKDLAAELRSRELLGAMLVFALLVILIFNFALELDIRTLGLNRSMALEKDRGCLDGLLLAPVDRSAIFFGKALGNLAFMFLVEAIVIPVYSLLYNTNLFVPGLLAVVVLGSLGYVMVGTLLASMSVQARTRDLLLPILLFPVVLPVLIAAVRASSGFLQGLEMAEIWPWLNLLIVYDVIFTAVPLMVYDYVVEE